MGAGLDSDTVECAGVDVKGVWWRSSILMVVEGSTVGVSEAIMAAASIIVVVCER